MTHSSLTKGSMVYVDTSALGALLICQAESQALMRWLDETPDHLVSTDLLETELRRMAVRENLDQEDVSRLLAGIDIFSLDRAAYRSTGFLPMPYLRTLDALHLQAALRLDASAILTYDHRLGDAARVAGLGVVAPGRESPAS